MNARNAFVPAVMSALLAGAGCSSTGAPTSAPVLSSSAAPLAATGGSPVSVNGTLVDCGAGRQALVQPVNGAAAVSCVPAPVAPAVGVVEAPLAPRPIGYLADAAPPARTVSPTPSYRPSPVSRRAAAREGRSWKKSAAIIGGSTAAGAGVGAILDGGSGAKKGAVVGLLGGTIYDIATRNR